MLALAVHKLCALQQSLNSFPHFKWKKKKRSNNNIGILEEYDDCAFPWVIPGMLWNQWILIITNKLVKCKDFSVMIKTRYLLLTLWMCWVICQASCLCVHTVQLALNVWTTQPSCLSLGKLTLRARTSVTSSQCKFLLNNKNMLL